MHRSSLIAGGVVLLAVSGALAGAEAKKNSGGKRASEPAGIGVRNTALHRQMSALKPDAVITLPDSPSSLAVTDTAVWVVGAASGSVHRVDRSSNKVTATIKVGRQPCSGILVAFESIWVPNCGDQTLSRIDTKTDKVIATLPVGPAHAEGSFTASPDSIWMVSGDGGTLVRIDPQANKVVSEIMVPHGSSACAYADGAIWVSSPSANALVRIDSATNLVTGSIEVGPSPRLVAAGDASVWTWNAGDGSVSRVEAESKRLLSTIEVGLPVSEGSIRFRGDALWLSAPQAPITRIHAKANKVTHQWLGAGGDAIEVDDQFIWLGNIRDRTVWRLSAKLP